MVLMFAVGSRPIAKTEAAENGVMAASTYRLKESNHGRRPTSKDLSVDPTCSRGCVQVFWFEA